MSLRKMSSAARARRLVVGVLTCGGAVGASIGLATSLATGAVRYSTPVAAAASTALQLNQVMVMNIASIQGNTIIADGQEVTGQINGVVSFKLTLLNGSRVTGNFTISNNGHIGRRHRKGTMLGSSDGNFHVSGALSSFSGRITSMRGTEEFAHAKSLGISASGSFNRRTYKMTVTLKGRFIE